MTQFIDEHAREELAPALAGLTRPVRLVLFTQEHACGTCREQQQLLEELAALSGKLTVEVHDLVADAALATSYRVSRVPATAVVSGDDDPGIRFTGVTLGYEFASLIEAISMVSAGQSGLEPELARWVSLIGEPLHLEIMVTLTCPYCPRMVKLAHQLAAASPLIFSEMIDAAEFPDLAQRYQVSGVPRTVINERPAFEGALPPADAILEILKTASPAAYEQIDAELRTARGERKIHPLDPGHRYDVLIVGAGPAAMTAAVYAARKNLDVALIGEHPGGQITDTALVENWPGVPQAGGIELAEAFRDHAERHPVAEQLHTTVTSVERADGAFRIRTADGAAYQAAAVIYAAGARYRRLGVSGENRFIGHGISFCATCDAPLLRDKRVAIIGGGNSAFTAARDLLPFAAEIHLVNVLPGWQADPVLLAEVTADPRVRLHPATEVKEFLGTSQLTGIRLQATDGTQRIDLPIDGAFLEIGLTPNSRPLASLLTLTPGGEIPAGPGQSTTIPGLFAAGDVTDEPDKQIVTAAAAGAKAALAAHRYLLAHAPHIPATTAQEGSASPRTQARRRREPARR
jgi:alkyl hydroperoxide reductase subunit F